MEWMPVPDVNICYDNIIGFNHSNSLFDCQIASSFELPHHLVVNRIIERESVHIFGEINLRHRLHDLIEVIGAHFIHDGIGVGEDELDVVTVFLLHHVIMEPNVTYEMGSE